MLSNYIGKYKGMNLMKKFWNKIRVRMIRENCILGYIIVDNLRI